MELIFRLLHIISCRRFRTWWYLLTWRCFRINLFCHRRHISWLINRSIRGYLGILFLRMMVWTIILGIWIFSFRRWWFIHLVIRRSFLWQLIFCRLLILIHSYRRRNIIFLWYLWRFLFRLMRRMIIRLQIIISSCIRSSFFRPNRFSWWHVVRHILHKLGRCEWLRHLNLRRYRWFFLMNIRIRRLGWQRRMMGRWRFRTWFRSFFLCWLLGLMELRLRDMDVHLGRLLIHYNSNCARFFPYRPSCWWYLIRLDISRSRLLFWIRLLLRRRRLCCPYRPWYLAFLVFRRRLGMRLLGHHLRQYQLCTYLIRYQ